MRRISLVTLLSLVALGSQFLRADPLGTAFTYQGRLADGSNAANGRFDFSFTLWNQDTGGVQLGGTQNFAAVPVSNGLFLVTLDFGNEFDGNARWLAIAVKTNLAVSYTTLTPRQPLKPAPYALHATVADGVALGSVSLAGLDTSSVDTRYVLKAGDTMSGPLTAPDLVVSPGSVRSRRLENDAGGILSISAGSDIEFQIDKLGPAFSYFEVFNRAGNHVFWVDELGNSQVYGSLLANGPVTAPSFTGNGAALTGLNAANLATGTLPLARIADDSITAAKLASDSASLAKITAGRMTNAGNRVIISGPGPIDTNLFTGLSLQYEPGQGEGAIMSSYADGFSSLTFHTKAGFGEPIKKQMTIDRYGLVSINNSLVADANNLNTGGVTPGLTFGPNSGEGIASKRDAGGNQYGLDFYTGFARRLSLSWAGNLSLYDNTAYLRPFPDGNHGLGWYGPGKLFAGAAPDGPVLFGFSGGALGTEQNGTEKVALTWDSSGNVGIGGTNPPAAVLDVRGARNIGSANDGIVNIGSSSGLHVTLDNNELHAKNGTGNADLYLNDFGGNVFIANRALRVQSASRVGINRDATANALEVNGDASKSVAGSWLANSDARIKQDIQPVTGALDKLDQVRLVQFHYTDQYRATHTGIEDRAYLNVVAQEFQQVFPGWVKDSGEKLDNGEGILQVDTYPLTIYSAAAVQELHQQLKAKDARIADLEKRLERIERRLTQR